MKWKLPKSDVEIDLPETALPRHQFEVPGQLRKGLELELVLRSCSDSAGDVSTALERFSGRVSAENLTNILEVKTEPHLEIRDLMGDLWTGARDLTEYLRGIGWRVLPLSVDPYAALGAMSPYPFIRRIADTKHGAGVIRMVNCASLQVNVEVGDGNALLYVYKALSGITPLLLSMTANAPFHGGRPSGLLTMRPNLRSLELDAGWVCESIEETTWGDYFASRAKMCGIGPCMVAPWAHNGPMRMRVDRNFCIEFAQPDLPPDFARMEALALFLHDLTLRTLRAYVGEEDLPACLGSLHTMAQQKNVQEAAIRGRNGMFLDRNNQAMPTLDAIEALFTWVDQDYPLLRQPTGGEQAMQHFHELHGNTCGGCDDCLAPIQEVCRHLENQWIGQFSQDLV